MARSLRGGAALTEYPKINEQAKPTESDVVKNHLAAGTQGGGGQGLDDLYKDVVTKAAQAIEYYQRVKIWKKRYAQAVRFLAVLLFGAAGLVPVLDAVGLFQSGPVVVSASQTVTQEGLDSLLRDRYDFGQLGYLFAAVAAALLGFDKFLGFSSSWTRYITAELSIQKSLDRFRIDWAIANADPVKVADKSNPGERLRILKDFSMEISRIVEEETQVWVREFQSALASLEKAAREQEQAARPGTIQLTVERGNGVQALVKVFVNGQLRQTTTAQDIVIHGVRPGETDIQLVGTTASGEEVMTSRMVTVLSASTASVAIKLG